MKVSNAFLFGAVLMNLLLSSCYGWLRFLDVPAFGIISFASLICLLVYLGLELRKEAKP